MLVASFMRSAQGLTLYSLDGDTKNLNATDFDLPEVFVALKHLIETGDYKTVAANWGVESGMISKPVINGGTG